MPPLSPTLTTAARPVPTAVPRRRLGFVLAPVAVTILLMAASAPSPFYPILQQRLGISSAGIAAVFAVYAVALLLALLTVGSLSDGVGRRPVITIGFGLLAVSMLLLWSADSAALLFAARGLQGIASGFLLSALSATVTDFAPAGQSRRAALLNSVCPMLGLALGAVFGGLVLGATDTAAAVVFGSLAGAYVLLAAVIWLLPETSARAPGWVRELWPRAAVPAGARRMFVVCVPIIIAGWATGGLFLSLGPDIIIDALHLRGSASQALAIAILPFAGALAVLAMHRRSPRTTTIYGAGALAIGTLLTLVGLGVHSLGLYIVAVAIAGTGFGVGFMGVIGSLTPTVPPHRRAELFAAIYTASYLAFGVPTVVAGGLVGVVGLETTTMIYGTFVVLCAAAAAILRVRERA